MESTSSWELRSRRDGDVEGGRAGKLRGQVLMIPDMGAKSRGGVDEAAMDAEKMGVPRPGDRSVRRRLCGRLQVPKSLVSETLPGIHNRWDWANQAPQPKRREVSKESWRTVSYKCTWKTRALRKKAMSQRQPRVSRKASEKSVNDV